MFYLLVVLSAVVEGVHYYDGYNVEDSYKEYGDETTGPDSLRVRRYQLDANTFNLDDEYQVKDALNQIFSGRRLNEPLSPKEFTSFLDADYNISLTPITRINEALTLVKKWHRTTKQIYFPATKYSEEIIEEIYHNATELYQFFSKPPVNEVYMNGVDNTGYQTRSYSPHQLIPSRMEYPDNFIISTRSTKNVKVMKVPSRSTIGLPEARVPTRLSYVYQRMPFQQDDHIPSRSTEDMLRQGSSTDVSSADKGSSTGTGSSSTEAKGNGETTSEEAGSSSTEAKGNGETTSEEAGNTTVTGNPETPETPDTPETFETPETLETPGTAEVNGTTLPMCQMPKQPDPITTTTTTTTTKKTTLHFDIDKFLEIVSNLTYDYYTNLTQQVNETLQKMSMKPTCPTLSPPATDFDYMLFNDSMRGKCFVCGMETRGIPREADCADAFAGDFIPLVPQNPKAKGQIAQYRKYCAFRDVNNFVINNTMPRMMWGRWTGGCAVRWTDLSGVYTQRTCRSKHKAAVGSHFASKRMAKLEMALSHTDNGCIISPVATLLPLSRGISLYARFHACVCTGSWCNGAGAGDMPLTHVVVSISVAMVTSVLFVQYTR